MIEDCSQEYIERTLAGYQVWQSKLFNRFEIAHGFLGADLDLYDEQALENATDALFGADPELQRINQVHGVTIFDATTASLPASAELPIADGIYTRETSQNKQILCIQTADCAPLLLASACGRIRFALHCGWRSAASGILPAAVEIATGLGLKVEELLLAIGPSAGKCCYEVGRDFPQILLKDKKSYFDLNCVFVENKGQLLFDLQRFLLLQAESHGLMPTNISILPMCTICNRQFFSYRRQKDDAGRQLSFIGGSGFCDDSQ